MSQWLWFVFAFGVILCWGAYGPTIHEGQIALKSPWKAILCVGGAYFVLAVIIPIVVLKAQGTPLDFHARGTVYASIAGALGALGAIFVVASLKTGGNPLYVMPLIFGGAPVVNVIVSSLLHRPARAPSPMLYVGFALLLAGAALVLYFKPPAAAHGGSLPGAGHGGGAPAAGAEADPGGGGKPASR